MKDFIDFRFGNYHSKDLHLLAVSSGDRYTKNLLPEPTDYTDEVPGGDGQYYYGQTYQNREFTINVAFDKVSEEDFRKISQLFAIDKPQDLVFDEQPYKVYRAKIKSAPNFTYICFMDKEKKERVYKGEGTLNFICYYPYAYCFNRYVVRAADYYQCLQPKDIIIESIYNNYPYEKKTPPKMLPGRVKDHYNVRPNLNTPWKGGYPSKDQVQWGELYFNDPTDNKRKNIIDVRRYWDNIPEWQGAAKLLTTPTLDYEQELIFLPQYCKTNYYDMDTGLYQQSHLIGSRLMVYNPGDVPVDFKLNLGNLRSDFRGNTDNYTFRISRYNVQRLTIEQAVDWTGLTCFDSKYDEDYKYGNRYFTIREHEENDSEIIEPNDILLKNSHPRHCYVVEPIPREKLGYFIRLFYWQSSKTEDYMASHVVNFEEGQEIAARYEELYDLCNSDEERFCLYWKTLKEAILDRYKEADEYIKNCVDRDGGFFNENYTYEDFCHDYIYKPPEYLRERVNLKYGQFFFNLCRLPQYYTFDYLDVDSKNFEKIPFNPCRCDYCKCHDDLLRPAIKPLILDTEQRALYCEIKPEWRDSRLWSGKQWQEKNQDKLDNFFNFKTTKMYFNDNIKKGHWFKLPPGWSVIDVSPIVDEDIWGGKRWLDARSFIWGTTDEDFRKEFDSVYRSAAIYYLSRNITTSFLEKTAANYGDELPEERTIESLTKFFTDLPLDKLENYMMFRRWYSGEYALSYDGVITPPYSDEVRPPGPIWGTDIFDKDGNLLRDEGEFYEDQKWKDSLLGFGYELQIRKTELAEYGFLKTLAEFWHAHRVNVNCSCVGDLDEWWWYANDYIFDNFPPLYWGYADLLNKAEIEYVPLYY